MRYQITAAEAVRRLRADLDETFRRLSVEFPYQGRKPEGMAGTTLRIEHGGYTLSFLLNPPRSAEFYWEDDGEAMAARPAGEGHRQAR